MKHLKETLQELAALPNDRPMGMPGAFYTSQEYYEHETRTVLRSGWHCLGREDEIPNTGDYFTATVVDEPLLVFAVMTATYASWQMYVATEVCPWPRGVETQIGLFAVIMPGPMDMTGHFFAHHACKMRGLTRKTVVCRNINRSYGMALFT